eukprot:5082286-Pyramimonas_sp.AAC.1
MACARARKSNETNTLHRVAFFDVEASRTQLAHLICRFEFSRLTWPLCKRVCAARSHARAGNGGYTFCHHALFHVQASSVRVKSLVCTV